MENSNIEKRFGFLQSTLLDNIDDLKTNHKKAKCQAFWMKLIIVSLSASIPMILGLNFSPVQI